MFEKKRRNFKITFKTFLILTSILMIIIPSIVVGVFSYQSAKRAMMNSINSNARNSINILSENINQTIGDQEVRLNYLAKMIQADRMKSDSVKQLLSSQFHGTHVTENVSAANEQGFNINGNGEKTPKGFKPQSRPWYKLAMNHPGKMVLTEPYRSTSTGNYVVSLAKTTRDNKGVINLTIDISALQKLVKKVHIGKEGYASLYSSKNIALVSNLVKVGNLAPNKELLTKSEGSYFSNQKGDRHQVNFIHDKLTGWIIIGNISETEINADLHGIFIQTIIICVIMAIIGSLIALFIVQIIIKPIKKIAEVSSRVMSKDLTQKVRIKSFVEFEQLGEGFNKMIDELSDILRSVNEKSGILASSSEELTASTEESKATIDEIAKSIQEMAIGANHSYQQTEATAGSTESIKQQIINIDGNADQLHQASNDAMNKVELGQTTLNQTSNQIKIIDEKQAEALKTFEEFNKQVVNIEKMNQLIDDISEQTQLLSLNAAIEAARAGEEGRGFAVVADEIRKLAAQSNDSTKKISEVVNMLQELSKKSLESMTTGSSEISKGIELVNVTAHSFENITHSMHSVSEEVQQVTKAIKLITQDTKQVDEAVKSINEATSKVSSETQSASAASEEQSASMEEIASNATSLSEMAEELQQLVSTFKIK
ncbi:methyl-accepting chemotaxis protein [Sporolactobacillus kofuensis]|uniref:Methyl-accepting chemotaxis protein n=1 Tax=Sporolactobacillus kofuensis TaxID=269672 RepID=A0ABW1WFY7_9BACL|nr:methyl-accepting chemotaxis protein [Sporolactobacillus kofuensis]MCO7175463.1 methyl-accepting chemotaxis protein [Sporolactobacillus kofuensis]